MTTKSKSTSNNPVPNFYRASAEDFKKIPGSPIAYWVSVKNRNIFDKLPSIEKNVVARQGLATGDNNRFLRLWWEANYKNIYFHAESRIQAKESGCCWFPCNKGGEFRKWYGNNEYIVNWENDGLEIRNFRDKNGKLRSRPQNMDYYFLESVSWSDVTSGSNSFRIYPNGFIFDATGHSAFISNRCTKEQLLSFCNNKFTNKIVKILNPTMHFHIGYFNVLPAAFIDEKSAQIIVNRTIQHAKTDWNSYETSWDFETLPILSPEYKSPTIKESYTKLRSYWQEMTDEMQRLEEENNHIFIEAYGLQDELTPDVPLSEITLTCNPHYRYNGNKTEEELEALLLKDTMKELISYAVGCMFGRYSLDKPGLVLANQGETIDDYLEQVQKTAFLPDDDNIIPVLDDEYFKDDIVSRFKDFLKVTFGRENLSANLDFIAKALSDRSTISPEAVIRDYFIKQFYKDHVQTYKKRPIYWMFSSGKNQGFNALIYMHRYDKSTLAKMRTDYLLELESKLIAEVEMLSGDQTKNKARLTKIKNQVEEMQKYDELLNNKSLQQIEIDLDDGVKVNYEKFEGLVRGV
ncbi:BREX-1 system adenine-specific DNA-methyltransferase PglX [Methanomicrobium antiquum]|uniref:BREX-1 system adenine-specific DNA-methyltransferase PglX n=1 Tax=Methanomicrobium antiquum TaxID=487686 RepID=A0AAF0FU29_9EURY|nr:BREX-1 system adenine-specific DNA-methyltransferase PglX [Methanomicrobium antiquum]WFN37956.1 BREX-1 system adenine-specific DNA-methyltransferase PglX [Methanomicrobium antiquum]